MHHFDQFLLQSVRMGCGMRRRCLSSPSTGGEWRPSAQPKTVRLPRLVVVRHAADFSRSPPAGSAHCSSSRQVLIRLQTARCVTYSIMRGRAGVILPVLQVNVLCARMRLCWRDKAVWSFLLRTAGLSSTLAHNASF